MNKQAIQRLFVKTARILREQEVKIANQASVVEELQKKIIDSETRNRARSLAKKAGIRGIIDTDVEAVEKYAEDILASGKSLDIVDEALKMASRVSDFKAVDELGKEASGGKLDPITAALFGMSV